MRPIDLEDYEGHGTHWKAHFFEDGSVAVGGVCKLFTEETGYRTRERIKANALLIQDAPLLVLEIKRLHQEINQLPIDLHESLDMILEAHHPEVRESVMSMFGDAWGNNVVGYDE